ncbi:hybrid sensor histidine kinase/response regulator [Parazoarcus communis]|uniref:Virulence sensor protein BvgS n=1 Tax=Parazoarcus communis SWub3 = DSM 12120 TaxID=1121029 RepID=A0A323UUJ6_9RHOO|nr:ATP-binding protein [Parazoarcus communis]NMG70901.1 response regulator [Parazoarcus communis SWub3 = DSM 12120]PZA16209.1 hypothetical protein DNK49_12915 [Azoarcus communis] [Parazoarcus communis SWub3 = DSM 12120]
MAGLSLGRGMRQLAAATVISLVAIALVIGAHLWQMRGEIEGVGRKQMASVAVFLAFEANRQFTVAQLIAADAMQAWKAGGDPDERNQTIRTAFQHGLRNDPALREIVLIDAEGQVLLATRDALRGQRLAGHDFLAAAQPELAYLGLPQTGRGLLPSMPPAHPAAAQEGFFTLTFAQQDLRVVFVLGAANVLNHFGRLTQDETGGEVRLHRYDGALLASSRAAAAGPNPIFRDFLPAVERGGFVDETPSGEVWFAHFATLDDFPLVIEYRRPQAALLASWRAELRSSVVTLAVVSFIVLMFAVAVFRVLRELTAARDAAQAAAQAKASFLATMSHELRTPMHGILGMAELLDASPLSPAQREHLAVLRRSGRLLLTILNDVLDFSKIDAGHLTLERIAFSPLDEAGEVIRVLEPAAQAQNNQLSLLADPALVQRMGDPNRFRQLLFNLVGNAIKFTRDGLVQVRLESLATTPGAVPVLRCEVKDSGIGIAPEVLSRLFTAFEQGDSSTTRKYGGTGLGLAISRRLAEAMGGRIGVESRQHEGACFWFELPLPLAESAPVQVSSMPATGSSARVAAPAVPSAVEVEVEVEGADPAPIVKGLKILVAEDNPTNRMLIQAMLARKGHRLEMAEDGQAAFERASEADYDVVLMDIQMPRMDGYQAASAIRALPGARARVPIVALTADALLEERDKALQSGLFQHYLTKPIDWALLDATLARFKPV